MMTSAETTATEPTPAPVKKTVAKPRRLAHWEPDPRWAHPLAAALWVYVLGVVAHLPAFGVPAWVGPVVGVAAAVAATTRVRHLYAEVEYGPNTRSGLTVVVVLSGLAVGAWLWWAIASSPLSAVGWLAIATVWFGGWYAVLHTAAPKDAAAIRAALDSQRQVEEANAAIKAWRAILDASGVGLRIAEHRPTRAGYVLGVEPADSTKPVGIDTLRQRLPDITVKAASLLAESGVTVRDGDIRVEATDAAHVHLIHVCTKHVLSQTIPYDGIPQPTTIADPIDPALYEDGRPVELVLGGANGGTNGKIVGATGSGKTVLANCIIGRVGECVDALVFVLASDKLVPLVYPWVKPWLDGRAARPGVDFVAGQDPQRVLEGLAMVYRIVKSRNDGLSNEATHTPTSQAPAIVVFVEEAGDMSPRRNTITLFDGLTVGFSQLLHLICKADRSAQVSLLLMNQSDLYGSLGDHGPDIARNTPLRVCLKTLSFSDGPSVLPGLTGTGTDTTKLRHHSMLVQPSIEEPRVLPAKSYKLAGDEVHPIAIRNAEWRPELELELVSVLGDAWTGRWDAARLPELAAAARRDGLEWPVGQPEDQMDVELRRLLEQETKPPAGEHGFPDAEAGAAELSAIANRPALQLPEPLASVMSLLAEPQAPKDFISTRQLAILLGRVAADAAEDQLREAARKLGRDLSSVDAELRSTQKGRLQGYEVALLREVATRIARGGR